LKYILFEVGSLLSGAGGDDHVSFLRLLPASSNNLLLGNF